MTLNGSLVKNCYYLFKHWPSYQKYYGRGQQIEAENAETLSWSPAQKVCLDLQQNNFAQQTPTTEGD